MTTHAVPPDDDDAPDLLPKDKIIDVGDAPDDDADADNAAELIEHLTSSPLAVAINERYGALDMSASDVLPGRDCDCQGCRSRREHLDDALRSFVQRTQLYPSNDGGLNVTMPTHDAPAQVTLTPEREDGTERTTDTIARHARAWLPAEQLARAIATVKERREATVTLAKAIIAHHSLAARGCRQCDSARDADSGEWERTCNESGLCGVNPLRQLGEYSGWSVAVAQRVFDEAQAEIQRDIKIGHAGRVAQEATDKAADAANAVPLRSLPRDASGQYVPPQRVSVEQMLAEMKVNSDGFVPLTPLVFPAGPATH